MVHSVLAKNWLANLLAMLRARDVVVADAAHGPWLEGVGAEAVLVRPDRYIFGAARDADEMRALVAALSGPVPRTGLRRGDRAAR